MRIQGLLNNYTPFNGLKINTDGNIKTFDTINTYNKNLDDSFCYSIEQEYPGRYNLSGRETGKYQDTVARAELEFTENPSTIFIDNVEVFAKNKQKHGLGSVLVLGTIIEMLENNSSKITLTSVGSALPFYSRFRFYPQENKWNDLQKIIEDIAMDIDPEVKKYSLEAAKLLKGNSKYTNCERTSKANQILYNYLQHSIKYKNKNELPQLFTSSANMCLTAEKVHQNKDFFNKLFKKYNIDYEVSNKE